MLAAEGVRHQPFLDELQSGVPVVAGVVNVLPLEETTFIATAVRIEILEGDPLAGRELVREVADDTELRALRAGLHVVIARRIEGVVIPNPEEAPILLDELLFIGVRNAGDNTQVAKPVAERAAPILPGPAALVDRPPAVLQQSPEVGDFGLRKADVRCVDAAPDDLVVRESPGSARAPSSKPSQSRLPSGLIGKSSPVAVV